MSSQEYLLSNKDPVITESLKTRIKYSMPYSVKSVSTSVYDRLNLDLLKVNFIIHEMEQLPGLPVNDVDSLNFKVSFLQRDAVPNTTWNNVWISGAVMNSLISPNMNKKKFIYDGTIFMKEGWNSRGVSPLKTPYNENSM